MGQEQSYLGHASVAPVKKYQDKYEDPIQYRASSIDYRTSDYEIKDYRRHKVRRSADSFKSDNSSTESSGYRSGSSGYECRSERSSNCDYYCTSLYKNGHYKAINKELYKPVKIPKEKRLKQLNDEKEEIKSARLKSYLSDAEKAKLRSEPSPKKAGIRNYTPKIISSEEQRKKLENWI
ncbi:uncharacterized protein LOC123871458 [Maniola jurtina]|uniref:uncharacterized protein LOC123871458 n=1 Tax=Maniola jurtina TaxID=191418 RepID=UPI001E68F174|nr:uncharacterized protein LOC123871458 [Maniola jurtina]XP_045771254.1 uncharacterized protein LOC123871458 [Maniola jurtina]